MDVLQGTVMVLMLNEVTQLPKVAESFLSQLVWSVVAYNTDHMPWQGCSVHDLIQSAFSFLVGAAASIHTAFEMN